MLSIENDEKYKLTAAPVISNLQCAFAPYITSGVLEDMNPLGSVYVWSGVQRARKIKEVQYLINSNNII